MKLSKLLPKCPIVILWWKWSEYHQRSDLYFKTLDMRRPKGSRWMACGPVFLIPSLEKLLDDLRAKGVEGKEKAA